MCAVSVPAIGRLQPDKAAAGLPYWAFVLHAAVFLGLGAAFLIWAVRVSPGIWLSNPAPLEPSETHPTADRVLAAKAQAAMAEGLDQPVLSIAYEVGFGSVGPFNRAFRAADGLSPTEYRKSGFGQAKG